MISGTQDDGDTQSDEAEAEAEEEQSEEAKVAADPEDQPAATETPKEEKKGRKRNTEKGSCRERLRQYFLRRKKSLLKKRQKIWHSSMITPARSPC